jgi:hypothetical protein
MDMFPEAFVARPMSGFTGAIISDRGETIVEPRNSERSILGGKSLWLNDAICEWRLVKDDVNQSCLVPTRRPGR